MGETWSSDGVQDARMFRAAKVIGLSILCDDPEPFLVRDRVLWELLLVVGKLPGCPIDGVVRAV